jgi:hypothetical protein
VATQLAFEEFKLTKLQVPPSRPEFAKGFPFEFELGRKMVQEVGSYAKRSKDPTTQTSTPKSMEELVAKVMKANKAVELFQTMAIVSLNMGNLTMEIKILKNRLTTREKEKAML